MRHISEIMAEADEWIRRASPEELRAWTDELDRMVIEGNPLRWQIAVGLLDSIRRHEYGEGV